MTIPMRLPDTIQSVVQSRHNGPLIAAAATLWIEPGDIVLDVTYGRGRFWTEYQPASLITHDLDIDGVDFRDLPEAEASIDVVVFDPPYISAARETDLSTAGDFKTRYGLDSGPRDFAAVEQLYVSGSREAARVLRPGGRLLTKCIDYVDGRLFRTGHHAAVNAALDAGLRQVDEFVHYSGTGPISQNGDQIHSRRAHSFLCIFRKPHHAG